MKAISKLHSKKAEKCSRKGEYDQLRNQKQHFSPLPIAHSASKKASWNFQKNSFLKACMRRSSTQIRNYIRRFLTFADSDSQWDRIGIEEFDKQSCLVSLTVKRSPRFTLEGDHDSDKFAIFDIPKGEGHACTHASEGALENESAANHVHQINILALSPSEKPRTVFPSPDIRPISAGSRDNLQRVSKTIFLKLHMMQSASKDKARLHEELGVSMHACYSYVSKLQLPPGDKLISEKNLYDMFREQSLFVTSCSEAP